MQKMSSRLQNHGSKEPNGALKSAVSAQKSKKIFSASASVNSSFNFPKYSMTQKKQPKSKQHKQKLLQISNYKNQNNQQSYRILAKAYKGLYLYQQAVCHYQKIQNKNEYQVLQYFECLCQLGRNIQIQKLLELEQIIWLKHIKQGQQIVEFLTKLGYIYTCLFKNSQAFALFHKADQILQLENKLIDIHHCTLLSHIALVHMEKGYIIQSAKFLKQSLLILEQINKNEYNQQSITLFINLAIVCRSFGYYQKFQQLFNMAISNSQIIKGKESQLHIISVIKLIKCYNMNNDNDRKDSKCMELLQKYTGIILEQFGTQSMLYFWIKQQQGVYYINKQCSVMAVNSLTQCLNIADILNQQSSKPRIYLLLAQALLIISSFVKSMEYAKMAAELCLQSKISQSIQRVIIGTKLVQIIHKMQLYQLEQSASLQVIQLMKNMNIEDSGQFIKMNINLCYLYQCQMKYDECSKILKQMLELKFNEDAINIYFIEINEILCKICGIQGKMKQADQFYHIIHQTNLKINHQLSQMKIVQ